MENLLVSKNADIQKAVEDIFDFFDTVISYSELVDEVLDCTFKVLDDYQDVENCDGDRRPLELAHDMRMMLDLMRPFAEIMGQNDKLYQPTRRYGRTRERIEYIRNNIKTT